MNDVYHTLDIFGIYFCCRIQDKSVGDIQWGDWWYYIPDSCYRLPSMDK